MGFMASLASVFFHKFNMSAGKRAGTETPKVSLKLIHHPGSANQRKYGSYNEDNQPPAIGFQVVFGDAGGMGFATFSVYRGAILTGASSDQGTVANPATLFQVGRALCFAAAQAIKSRTLMALFEPKNPASAPIRKPRPVISILVMR